MDILDSVAFVLQPRPASSCPWLHSKAVDNVAAQLVQRGQEIAQHPLVGQPGALGPMGELVLTLAEIHDALGELLSDVAQGLRRNAMAAKIQAAPEPQLSEPLRPHLTLLPGGRSEEPTETIGGNNLVIPS